MEDESHAGESALRRYLSEVGIFAVHGNGIVFNSVDLDRALAALVEDGEHGLLEPLYSYLQPLRRINLSAQLRNWSDSHRAKMALLDGRKDWSDEDWEYWGHSEARCRHGGWETDVVYNLRTCRVEAFDWYRMQPPPADIVVIDRPEDYRRLSAIVERCRSLEYRLRDLSLEDCGENPDDWNGVYLSSGEGDGSRRCGLRVNDWDRGREMLGTLVPGLEARYG